MHRRRWQHRWQRGCTGFRQRFMALVRAPVRRRLAEERRVLVAAFDADPARQADYARWLPTLGPLFWRTRYWHGTGRYHYRRVGPSQPHARAAVIEDVLVHILAAGGLQPCYDPFGRQRDTGTPGVSIALARGRMYGRIYAAAHQDEAIPLGQVNGTTRTWYAAVMREVMVHYPLALLAPVGSRWLPRLQRLLQHRVARRRQDAYTHTISLFEAVAGSSDIRGNYGLLVAIRDEVRSVPISHAHDLVAVRTREPIPWAKMSHIEVPLAHVDATQRVLWHQGLRLPVLPLEYMDRYTIQVSYDYLIFGRFCESGSLLLDSRVVTCEDGIY